MSDNQGNVNIEVDEHGFSKADYDSLSRADYETQEAVVWSYISPIRAVSGEEPNKMTYQVACELASRSTLDYETCWTIMESWSRTNTDRSWDVPEDYYRRQLDDAFAAQESNRSPVRLMKRVQYLRIAEAERSRNENSVIENFGKGDVGEVAAQVAKKAISQKERARMSLLKTDKIVKPTWLFEGFIQSKTLTCLAGKPGAGKDLLMCLIAAHTTTGEDFPWGGKPIQGRVLYATTENPAGFIKARVKVAGGNLDHLKIIGRGDDCGQFRLDDPSTFEAMLEVIAETEGPPVSLIIIDPAPGFLSPRFPGEQESDYIRRQLDPLAAWSDKKGITVIYSKHSVKNAVEGSEVNDRASGTITWTALTRSSCVVERNSSYDQDGLKARALRAGRVSYGEEFTAAIFLIKPMDITDDNGENYKEALFQYIKTAKDESDYILPPATRQNRKVDSGPEKIDISANQKQARHAAILHAIRGTDNPGDGMGQGEIYSRVSDEVAESAAVDLGMTSESVRKIWKDQMQGRAVEIDETRYLCATVRQGNGAKSLWTITPIDDSAMTFPKIAN